MFCLDQRSHRYFIETVSKIKHIKIAFMKRFIKFTEQLACSTKRTTRNVFHIIKHDCRSITGHNLRKIMQYCGKSRISELTSVEVGKMTYHPISNNEVWQISLVEELLDIRSNSSNIDDWSKEELSDLLEYISTT